MIFELIAETEIFMNEKNFPSGEWLWKLVFMLFLKEFNQKVKNKIVVTCETYAAVKSF